MSILRLGFAAIVGIVGLSGAAQAQNALARPVLPGSNFNAGFAGTFGVPGTYSTTGSVSQSRYYGTFKYPVAPQAYDNTGGLAGMIRRQTGKPGSYRNGPAFGVTRKRPKS